VLFVSLLGCSGEITAEELCGRADEAGCFEGSGDSYDSCVAVNKPSEEEARRLGCVSEHQTLRACTSAPLPATRGRRQPSEGAVTPRSSIVMMMPAAFSARSFTRPTPGAIHIVPGPRSPRSPKRCSSS